jgi:hypothetical protein
MPLIIMKLPQSQEEYLALTERWPCPGTGRPEGMQEALWNGKERRGVFEKKSH